MRTVIITGANAGIGYATATFLAAQSGWHVLLACRNESKAEAAIDAIRQTRRHSQLSFVPLDLFSLASVRRFAAVVSEMAIPPLRMRSSCSPARRTIFRIRGPSSRSPAT